MMVRMKALCDNGSSCKGTVCVCVCACVCVRACAPETSAAQSQRFATNCWRL